MKLGILPTPSARPRLIASGTSETARDRAARTAERVITAEQPRPDALAFAADLRARRAALGRGQRALEILPIIFPVPARTRTEARDKAAAYVARIPAGIALRLLADRIGLDLVPDGPIPRLPGTNRLARAFDEARAADITLAELARRTFPTGHWLIAGTPEDIADVLEDRFLNGAADGFTLLPAPDGLADVNRLLLPELAHRGLIRPRPTVSHHHQGAHP